MSEFLMLINLMGAAMVATVSAFHVKEGRFALASCTAVVAAACLGASAMHMLNAVEELIRSLPQ